MNKKLKKENGQALVEFLLFLPFLVMIYSVLMSIGGSINGAINQEKVTRGYFKFRTQNNSFVPKPTWGGDPMSNKTIFGIWAIGFANSFKESSTPVKSCYKFNIPLANSNNDQCETPYTQNTTQFIRVGTVYGVCGATYVKSDYGVTYAPMSKNIAVVVGMDGCEIVQ